MKIPEKFTLEAIKEFARDVYAKIQVLSTGDFDLKGRRITNAGAAVDGFDYVRKADVDRAVKSIDSRITTSLAVDERRTALQADVIGDWRITGNLIWKSGTASEGMFDHAITAARTWTFPDATDDVVLRTTAQNLTRKTFGDPTDPTKVLALTLSGATAAKTMSLISVHTADRSLTLPDTTGTLAISGAVGAGSVTLAKITPGGTDGSITYNASGCITAVVAPT